MQILVFHPLHGESWRACNMIKLINPNVKNVLMSSEFLYRTPVILLLLAGIFLCNPFKIIFLILSGVISGIYYGCYNDIIWRPKPVKNLSKLPHYRAHQMWIHIFCGVVGAISLYYLSTILNKQNVVVLLEKHSFTILALSFITVMSYVGLLPRLLWFTSYGLGQFGKPPENNK